MVFNRIVLMRLFYSFFFWISLFCFPNYSFSGGFESYLIGARGKVLGGTLTGIADDPSSIFYNPAGLATLKSGPVHWEASASAIYINYDYKDSHDDNKEYESGLLKAIPTFFLSKTFSNNIAFGFGMYVPWGGGGVDYGQTSATQPIKDGYLGFAAFTPAVSYKISPEFSIGMGFSGYYGKVQQTFVPGPTIKEDYSGYAGYNAHFGVLVKPTNQLNLGLTARTPTKVSLDGKSQIVGINEQDATLEFTLPAKISAGLSYRWTDSLLIATNCSYLFYDNFEDMTTRYQSGQVLETKTGFKNYIDAGIALEYSGFENFVYRGSVRYSQSGTSNEFINAFNTDVEYMLFDFGIGYKITESLEIICNLGYNLGIDTANYNGEYNAYQFLSLIGLRTTY